MTIHVINPNSLTAVTDGIERAIAPMRDTYPTPIETHTLADGPPGIETQADVDLVVAPLLAQARRLEADASAMVIACYSDPGLATLREQINVPVLGIAEAAVLTALRMGQRFGVISILPTSIPRHMRQLGAMGVMDRCAGDRALGLGVRELADDRCTRIRLEEIGAELRDDLGAEVLILGCAGMADYRAEMQKSLGVPVVDPCQAATAMAIGALVLQTATREGL